MAIHRHAWLVGGVRLFVRVELVGLRPTTCRAWRVYYTIASRVHLAGRGKLVDILILPLGTSLQLSGCPRSQLELPKMSELEDLVSKHYTKVAGCYDDLYGFTNKYIAEFAVKHLNLKSDDRLVDIGAGTGAITSLIWKKAELNNPVLCVEQSLGMLDVARTKDGLTTCLASADGFLSDYLSKPRLYNKFLFNECAHLFTNRVDTFRKVYQCLPDDGVLLLMQRSTQCGFPMWKDLKERFTPASVEEFETSLTRAGFTVTMTIETGLSRMTKREWYGKLRGRIFTVLSEFSDKEIEDGIKELDQEWFPEKTEDDSVEIKDNLVCFTATKK